MLPYEEVPRVPPEENAEAIFCVTHPASGADLYTPCHWRHASLLIVPQPYFRQSSSSIPAATLPESVTIGAPPPGCVVPPAKYSPPT